jgi:hypothetical protein
VKQVEVQRNAVMPEFQQELPDGSTRTVLRAANRCIVAADEEVKRLVGGFCSMRSFTCADWHQTTGKNDLPHCRVRQRADIPVMAKRGLGASHHDISGELHG